MVLKYNPHIPETVGELIDQLSLMLLTSPLFEDPTGFFEGRNIDTEFEALTKGLNNTKVKLGSDRYMELAKMSAQMRACFEADPKGSSGETLKGRNIALDMIEILKSGKSADYWDE